MRIKNLLILSPDGEHCGVAFSGSKRPQVSAVLAKLWRSGRLAKVVRYEGDSLTVMLTEGGQNDHV